MPYQIDDIIIALSLLDSIAGRLGVHFQADRCPGPDSKVLVFGRDLVSGGMLIGEEGDKITACLLAETERAARDLLSWFPPDRELLLDIPQDWVLERARLQFDLQQVHETLYSSRRRSPGLPEGVLEFHAKVDSQKHPAVDKARTIQTERGRDELGMYAAHGPLLLSRALTARAPIQYVLFTPKFSSEPEFNQMLEKLRELHIPHYLITDGLMRKCVDTAYVPTVLSVLKKQLIDIRDLYLGPRSLVLVSESVEEAGNLGMILRTADAVAADAVLVCGTGCDPFAWKTVTGSRGSIFRVPVVHDRDSGRLLSALKEKGTMLIGADLSGDKSHYDLDYTSSTALMVGNESFGLTDIALQLCDHRILIPMPGEPDSLNVGVSSGVLLYEALRQRMAR